MMIKVSHPGEQDGQEQNPKIFQFTLFLLQLFENVSLEGNP